jgi:hypothetical protein
MYRALDADRTFRTGTSSGTLIVKKKGGEPEMKKTTSSLMLAKEAALWEKMKEAVQKRPATVCHK